MTEPRPFSSVLDGKGADGRVYLGGGGAEPQYRPDPTSLGVVEYLVAGTGGRPFGERAVSAAGRPGRRFPGRGLAVAQRQQKSTIALAPYVAITALAPLALLLWRRNLSWVASRGCV